MRLLLATLFFAAACTTTTPLVPDSRPEPDAPELDAAPVDGSPDCGAPPYGYMPPAVTIGSNPDGWPSVTMREDHYQDRIVRFHAEALAWMACQDPTFRPRCYALGCPDAGDVEACVTLGECSCMGAPCDPAPPTCVELGCPDLATQAPCSITGECYCAGTFCAP